MSTPRSSPLARPDHRVPGGELSRRFIVLSFIVCTTVAVSAELRAADPGSLRILGTTRAVVAGRTVTLAGLVDEPRCAGEAVVVVASLVARRVSRFVPVGDPEGNVGVVVFDNGRTLNELLIDTGCPRFDADGLPAHDPFVKALVRAAGRGGMIDALPAPAPTSSGAVITATAPSPAVLAATLTGVWNIAAKWTGSADRTTEAVALPAGEVRVVIMAIPSGDVGDVTVAMHDVDGRVLQTISTGPLTTRHMTSTAVRLERPSQVQFSITGRGVLWGVWAQLPR